ncbi:DUF1161 domain-containing protein [Pseudomonas sp. NPDC089734]|uniref:DUF1161 domain-containing protein n=1 Tax=Pseudomonas sp. NPDC089734 TaxID=3364469 RepID=UPI003804C67C
MKKLLLAVALLSLTGTAMAAKNCEELKAEVDAKIKAHGDFPFTLEIVRTEDVRDAKVVGSCEGGRNKLIYKRG